MNTCKTCRLWDTSDWAKYKSHQPIAECTCPKIHEGRWPKEGEKCDHLIYSYDEGGRFFTGEDFGCVHHEEREE